MRMTYRMKFGLPGRLMDLMMARRQFRKMANAVLEGLKHHVETGDVIEDGVPARALEPSPV